MSENWTPYEAAQALVKLMPLLGRTIGPKMRENNEDAGTLIQVLALKQMRDQSINVSEEKLKQMHDKLFTVSELAKRRKVSLQSASTLVQRLVERGWLERTENPNDRRQALLELTPEGMAHAQATLDQIVGYLAEYLESLTPEELQAAQVFLPALSRAMQVSPEEEVPER